MGLDRDKITNRNQNRSTVVGCNGMVCASQPLASAAGMDILKAGGNAIDAAIAANAVLGVVEPMSCGLGGDLFAIVWSEKEHKLFGLNSSGRAPYDWNITEARKLGLAEIPTRGPLSWSVPGCVSGWDTLRVRFGSCEFDQLLKPAIAYAHNGFPVSPIIAGHWALVATANEPTLAATYAPDGKLPGYGDMFCNRDLGRVMEIIAREGAGAFYQGEIADRLVRFSKANGGRLSARDLIDHKSDWIEPVSSSYRGYDVWEMPPNGQGIAALQMLNMLELFDIAALTPNSAEQLHLFIEAKKLVFEDRAIYYADPNFADIPVEQLISKEYAKDRAKLIDQKRAAQQVNAGHVPASSDTVYLTAADSDGNMVSLIQSIYQGFGSKIVPDGLGFAMQNRGALFSLDPTHRNCLEPHKRPFNTIIPGFVTRDSQPCFSFGVMGGDFQPQGHAQVLMNIIDYGMSPQQAGEQPRVDHSESSTPTGRASVDGGLVTLEEHIPDSVRQQLTEMGHKVSSGVAVFGVFGGYQGIWRDEEPRRYFGGSDPRKDGCAIGY
jgi:gamma-glutamyltranspeptidase/glutathione hydrolase